MPFSDQQKMAHLLRRAGFGATPEELARYLDLGYEAAVEELLYPERVEPDPEGLDDLFKRHHPEWAELVDPIDGQVWWMHRLLTTRAPLREKMTLFWHDHFATSYVKVRRIRLMFQQYEMLRRHALGNFEDMVLAVSRDPAMILWLDNNTNRRDAPNENYARELLELFTLGIGNYSEDDVREAARAFTGWNIRGRRFFFAAEEHDYGEKQVLGQRGAFDGDDVVALAVRHPAAGRLLAAKLYRYLVADGDPEADALQALAQVYYQSNFEIREVLRALFHSPSFLSEQAYYGKVKAPVEYVVGTLRLFGLSEVVPLPQSVRVAAAMGQELFRPPDVGGWQEGAAWINTATLMTRVNFAAGLAQRGGMPLMRAVVREFRRAASPPAPEEIVEFVLQWLSLDPSAKTRERLLAFARQYADPRLATEPRAYVERLRALLGLVVSVPEFQLA